MGGSQSPMSKFKVVDRSTAQFASLCSEHELEQMIRIGGKGGSQEEVHEGKGSFPPTQLMLYALSCCDGAIA